MMVRAVFAACIVLIGFTHVELVSAEDIARLQAGVVKVTAKPPQGTTNVGTGFIVRVDKDAAYIVTAAHVVAGDQQPKVEFFTKRNMPVMAEVLGLEGDDEVRGLALLVVKGAENIPKGLTSLSLVGAARLTGGEDILVIGFPRNAGPWAIVKGNISSRQGRDIFFSPSVESGHSGGPIFQGGKVVGVVGSGGQSVGRGVTVGSVEDYLEGFGITAQESAGSSSASTTPAPSPPPPAATAKPEVQSITLAREITGKDGAPMVLIPAGEFWMGSPDSEGRKDEHPRHQIYLDGFYMDKFEVTVARYTEFVRAKNRPKPGYWDQVDSSKHWNLPVVGVNWDDAKAYCEWAGKRLPTEAEWEKAARGTDGRTYSWGNEGPTARLANFAKGLTTRAYKEGLAPVDSYEAGNSPYGLHHMAGNVWEWTADWYDETYYIKSPARNPTGPASGLFRVVRGGSWSYEPDVLRSAYRHKDLPTSRSDSIGFRCAQDVPK
ncbi:MAG: SUMF1/EgtB/PvdO family nonheme iron enzyme [Nitrospira sp.]|nr:SUMF1/EgtB/PvdO family nonheme iron enzyme [Nitrospira sp.]